MASKWLLVAPVAGALGIAAGVTPNQTDVNRQHFSD